MALIQCPECGKEISNKAQACPHCGKPMQEEKEYALSTCKPGTCNAAMFFYVIAWILWIGGIVVAIVTSLASKYDYHSSFNWGNFFETLQIYFLYGGSSYCMANVIDYIAGIYTAIVSLELYTKNKH